VGAERQPRRLAFGRGPLPEGSELELLAGPLDEELARLAEEGIQSLLLEGGPTLATGFLAAGLVDRLLLFVAPTLAGTGPRFPGELPEAQRLLHASVERLGDDVLLSGYLREP
jgi:diaminohydroxyphosphoribosylaminopyrimidine deaminase/5-amino-6-(5-phosphoribosylamino)uracil reductase